MYVCDLWCRWPVDGAACVCEHVWEYMSEADFASYNDHIDSEQKVGQNKEEEGESETRKGTDEKGRGVKESEDKLPGKRRGERTIAIATAVFLPSSNNCLMSDASSCS